MKFKPPSETSARERYFRVSASDLFLASDVIEGNQYIGPYQFVKKYQHGGNRIFCDTIDGGSSWGIRLGSSDNPIIRLRPGRTIQKTFRYFTLYCTQPSQQFSAPIGGMTPEGGGDGQETVLELYISTGDLILDSPREHGKGFGPRSVGRTNCVADTTSRLILADINNPGGFPNNANITQWKPGRHGATLLLRNADEGGNVLYIANQSSLFFTPVMRTEMFRLYAGEVLILDLDGSIQQSFNQQKIIGAPDIGFVVYTKSGTVNYDWMLSRLDCDPAPARAYQFPDVGLNLG